MNLNMVVNELKNNTRLQVGIALILALYVGVVPPQLTNTVKQLLNHPMARMAFYAGAAVMAKCDMKIAIMLVLAYHLSVMFVDTLTVAEKFETKPSGDSDALAVASSLALTVHAFFAFSCCSCISGVKGSVSG